MAMAETGIVKWFNQGLGYGFIKREDADDLFVHYSAIQDEVDQVLEEGEVVEFELAEGPKGFMAANVSRM